MVRPSHAVVVRGIADLRSEPDHDAELVDQALYGERVTRLGERPEWAYVQGDDHYFGWIRGEHLSPGEPAGERFLVAVPLADIRDAPDPSAEAVDRLPAGSALAAAGPCAGEWLPVRHATRAIAWIALEDITAEADLPRRPPRPEDLLATARTYLGAPYRWGGTTLAGVDCSGLVQRVYRLNGVALDRDADQQSLEGRPVEPARPGDLLFFGVERVTHVGLAAGGRTFIHAPNRSGVVEVSSLDTAPEPRAIRRYLAE